MFKCQNCQQSADRPTRVVVERNMVQHTAATVGPRGGRGSQIVREMNLCASCVPLVPEAPIERAQPGEIAPGITLNGKELAS